MLKRVIFQSGAQRWEAISVRVSEADDVYVNYLGDQKKRHTSFHASGQQHQKVGKRYVKWTNGVSGEWQAMKTYGSRPADVRGRHEVATWGWEVSTVPLVLSPTPGDHSDVIVDVFHLPNGAVIGLKISVIGDDIPERQEISGFQVVHRERISTGTITVEIEAFLVRDDNS